MKLENTTYEAEGTTRQQKRTDWWHVKFQTSWLQKEM